MTTVNITGKTKDLPVNSPISPDIVRWPAVNLSPGWISRFFFFFTLIYFQSSATYCIISAHYFEAFWRGLVCYMLNSVFETQHLRFILTYYLQNKDRVKMFNSIVFHNIWKYKFQSQILGDAARTLGKRLGIPVQRYGRGVGGQDHWPGDGGHWKKNQGGHPYQTPAPSPKKRWRLWTSRDF